MSAVFMHEATREYVYPISRQCIELKLTSSRAQGVACKLVYCNRLKNSCKEIKESNVICYARDSRFNYYRCRISEDEAVKYIRYYFEITEGGTTVYLHAHGVSADIPETGFFEYLYTNDNDIYESPDWAKNAIIYQIFPERFYNGDKLNDPDNVQPWEAKPTRENFLGGDMEGISQKLDYLAELRIDAIYLTPIFAAPSNHKYDTADYYQIDPAFGDMQTFGQLVKACHQRGIKVVLDGVFNHSGYYFEPFQDVLRNGEKSKYKDWFFIESFPVRTDPPNYECVGYYKWMPKLRFSNPDVRKYFLDVGAYWMEQADIDGWRLDVCDEVDFTFWQEFRIRIKAINKQAILLGETWKDGRDLLRGDQMDTVMNYLFRDAVADFIAEDKIDVYEFDSRIQKMRAVYASPILPLLYNLIGSHDTDRFLTLCGEDTRKLKLAVGFQMTFPGMPVIYYGDEIGMQGENDPDCRRAMLWDDINDDVLAFYKKIIRIRKANKCLSGGCFEVVVCQNGLYGYARRLDEEMVYVILNNTDQQQECSVPLIGAGAGAKAHSLLNVQTYSCNPYKKDRNDYNRDINNYTGYVDITVSGYNLEIIKIKEKR